MTGDDDQSRPTSQNSLGRRRWEAPSRESFEVELATQTPSPVKKSKNRGLNSASKSRNTFDSTNSYRTSQSSLEYKASRAKSAVRKGSRESEAEIKHALKMAEGRRTRGSSASSDRNILRDGKSVNNAGKIPVPVPRGSAKSIRRSHEDVSGGSISQSEDSSNSSGKRIKETISDSLTLKHSQIINAALHKKLNYTDDNTTAEETISREEGYETDEYKLNNLNMFSDKKKYRKNTHDNSEKSLPSAPPLESSDENTSKQLKPLSNSPDNKSPVKSFKSPKLVNPVPEKEIVMTTTPKKHKRKRKTRKPSIEIEAHKSGTPISLQLRKLQDDVIDSDQYNQNHSNGQFCDLAHSNIETVPGFIVNNNKKSRTRDVDIEKQDGNISTIYCENAHGFVLSNDGKKYIQDKRKKFGKYL